MEYGIWNTEFFGFKVDENNAKYGQKSSITGTYLKTAGNFQEISLNCGKFRGNHLSLREILGKSALLRGKFSGKFRELLGKFG